MNIAKRALNVFLLLVVGLFAIGIVESVQENYFSDGLIVPLCGVALIVAVNYVFFGKVTLWNKIGGRAAKDAS